MSTQLGEAFVPIRATMDKLDADLAGAKSKIQGAIEGVANNLKTIGKGIVAGFLGAVTAIGTGIVLAASKAIPAASDLNEALNASSVVFQESAGIIQKFGETASETAGLSARAFNQMAAETGAMLLNFGFSTDMAAEQTVNLTQRAADMASIFNTDVEDALGAIQSGLQGMSLPLRRFGVDMSDAAVRAKAMEMGLGNITRQTDQAAYSQAALALLFEQTDRIAGDFVNTSDQLANAQRVQAARWENFMARVGSFMLPIITEFQRVFMDLAEQVMPIVLDALAPVAETFMELTDAFVVFIGSITSGQDPLDALLDLVANIGMVFGASKESVTTLVDGIREFIDGVRAVAEPIIEAISQFVSWKDVLIAAAIAVAAFVLPALWGIVTAAAPVIAVGVALIAVIALVRNAWENDWGGIRTALTQFWETTGRPIFDQLREWLAVNIPKAIETLKNFWENVLLPAIQVVWNWISTVLVPFISGTLIPLIRDRVTQAIQNLKTFWTDVLLPAIQAVWSFIDTSLLPLFRALVDFFDAAFTLALTALSGLWQNVLQPALKAVGDYVSEKLQPVFQALEAFWSNVFGPALQKVKTNILDKLKGVFEGIRDAIGWVTDKLGKMADALRSIKLPDWLTPGSPTPFELGLRGINEALKELNRTPLMPEFDLDSIRPSMALVGAEGFGEEMTQNNYTSTTTIYTDRDPMRVLRASRHLDKLGATL